MIGYVTLGTNDLEKARAYYDALMPTIGARRLMELPHNGFTYYGKALTKPGIAIVPPHNGEKAIAGNGNMVAIAISSRSKVDAFHARAVELGGIDEGAPGLRGPEGPQAFYGGYFRDPDGNKICGFCLGAGRDED